MQGLMEKLKRELAIRSIDRRYDGLVSRGFVGDYQIMIELRYNDEPKFGYVCDAPKEYFGEPISHPFVII